MQAALLLDPAHETLLQALARAGAAGQGAAALARSAGQPLSTVHARLERLRAAGVVEVVAVQPRAGRPVRLYALPLPWHIPFEVTPAATLRELLGGGFGPHLTRQMDALARRMLHLSAGWRVTLSAAPDGLAHTIESPADTSGQEAMLGVGFQVHLRRERAAGFLKRLSELVGEYRDAPDSEDEPAWLGTFIFTLEDEGQKP